MRDVRGFGWTLSFFLFLLFLPFVLLLLVLFPDLDEPE